MAEHSLYICDNDVELTTLINQEKTFDLLLYSLKNGENTTTNLPYLSQITSLLPVIFLYDSSYSETKHQLNGYNFLYLPKSKENLENIAPVANFVIRSWEQEQANLLEGNNMYLKQIRNDRIFENINDVVWEIDLHTSSFSYISGSVKQLLGYTNREILNIKLTSILHRESLKSLRQLKNEILTNLLSGKKSTEIQFIKEVSFIHKNGSIVWGEVKGFVMGDEKHHIVSASGVVRNITRQREAIDELEIQEAYFETLIREAPLAIVILDNNDIIKQVNNHFTALFGFSEQECLDRYVNDLIVPDEYKEEGNALTIQAARGDYINYESIRKTKSGHMLDVHILGKPVMLKNAQLGVFGIYQDISQRKKMEVAAKVAEIKQQFLANMSHEIRSPMTGVMGMIELLSKTSLDEQQAFFVDVIRKSSDSLLEIVNDILDLSKIEAGKMIVKPRIFGLRKSAHTLFSLFNALTRKKGIDFTLHYDDVLPQFVYADENRISQIVTNLLSNAVKFTSDGEITLGYKSLKNTKQKHTVGISVTDTGIGINEEDTEKLFQIFSQLDTSDTRTFEGAGLGLSISQKLAELMDARIEVESSPGNGSKFTLVIDLDEGESSPVNSAPVEQNTPKSLQACNVLLTEDKRTNQMVISLMLQEIGCTVDVASNGLEAIEKIREKKFDFVFMDIQMPVMDGLTAVKELHSQYPYHELPYIIGLSAKAMEGDAEYHIAQGMDDYLFKPVTTDVLRNCLLKWAAKPKTI